MLHKLARASAAGLLSFSLVATALPGCGTARHDATSADTSATPMKQAPADSQESVPRGPDGEPATSEGP